MVPKGISNCVKVLDLISAARTTHVSWESALGPNRVASSRQPEEGTSYRKRAIHTSWRFTSHRERHETGSRQISAFAKTTRAFSGRDSMALNTSA
jgi:hypothetical protein